MEIVTQVGVKVNPSAAYRRARHIEQFWRFDFYMQVGLFQDSGRRTLLSCDALCQNCSCQEHRADDPIGFHHVSIFRERIPYKFKIGH